VREAWEKHGNGRVAFVGISLDGNSAEAARLKREWDIPYDVAVDDGTMSKNYEIEVLPTFVLVDAQGVVRHVSTGTPTSSDLDRWLTTTL
jgi:hypothetical protein